MRIGEVARKAGVNVQTLRYYERRGLLAEPLRTAGNYRTYAEDTVSRVSFIKRAQSLGFDLHEVADLLRLHDAPNRNPARVRALAERRLGDVERKLGELASMRDALQQLVASCKRRKRQRSCPILDALEHGTSLPAACAGDDT